MKYAENTSVSVDRSREELVRILRCYGAERFGTGEEPGMAFVAFEMHGRPVRLVLELPDPNDEEFSSTPTGRRRRNDQSRLAEWEKACRQKWRVLCLLLKAKLEAVEADAAKFDEEFLPYLVLKGGQTVGQKLLPEVERALQDGTMPRLLLTGAKEK